MFTISRKLYSGFLAILILMGVIISLGFYEISRVNDSYENLLQDRVDKVLRAKDMVIAVRERQVAGRGYLLTGNLEDKLSFQDLQKEFQKSSKELDAKLKTAKGKNLLKEIIEINKEYDDLMERAFNLKDENNTRAYTTIVSIETPPVVEKFAVKSDEFIKYQNSMLASQRNAAAEETKATQFWMLLIGIISLAVGLVVAYSISRVISRPVKRMAVAAEQIAGGDLTVDLIKIKNKDEIGQLANSFNRMGENLRQLIRHVSSTSEQVAASAEELMASADQTARATEQVTMSLQDVAVGAEKQVSSLDESSNAVNEMTIGVRQIAASAQNVSDHMGETSEAAQLGGEAVRDAVQQMGEINKTVTDLNQVVKGLGERSKQIGQIIDLITGIASQTNLLALNAAIEAARAGEQGKGFAVVADEVRQLAEQSAASARQIAGLIQLIQSETDHAVNSMTLTTRKVEEGIKAVDHTGTSFKQIQLSVEQVASQIVDVSSATQQMAAGAEQIAGNMDTISKISEESATASQMVSSSAQEQLASMEEITASANSLTNMAVELQELIGKFRI